MGYKQNLYRGFNALSSFSFCFTSVAVLSSISVSWTSYVGVGGPSVLIWGWVGSTIGVTTFLRSPLSTT
jgi:hypothetical protein